MAHVRADEHLTESLEDYLESILELGERQERVGTNDVAQAMKVKAASATRAIKELAQRGLVDRKPYGAIELTETGRDRAADVLHKHRALTNFFTTLLGVDEDRVEGMACHLEHVMPDDILERVITFADYVGNCPRGRVHWRDGQVNEDPSAADEQCKRCDGDQHEGCPALIGLQAPAGEALRPVRDLTGIETGTRCSLIAFRDDGSLHQRCSASGFKPGSALRVLSVQEGVMTLLNDDGQAMALVPEEAAQILVIEL